MGNSPGGGTFKMGGFGMDGGERMYLQLYACTFSTVAAHELLAAAHHSACAIVENPSAENANQHAYLPRANQQAPVIPLSRS